MATAISVPMGQYLALFDDLTGEALNTPELRQAPMDDIVRAHAAHEQIVRTALIKGKQVEELTRADLAPYDVTDRRADRGTHKDPVLAAVIGRFNNWHNQRTRRLHFKDGSTSLTIEEIQRLKAAGCGTGIDPRNLTRAQVHAFLNGGAR